MLLAGSTATTAGGRRTSDEVLVLPGWAGTLPSRMFSGYIAATPKGETLPMHMKYTFFESEGNPETDPLLIWSNGGPGAGSEFGLFTELGPLELYDASLRTADYNRTGIPTLWRNDYAWTKVASLLIYDAPPPVGFSYCADDPGGDGYSCGDWDDDRTARVVHTFVDNWMKAFPAFAARDLFLSGESYAGVYIPMLAREILDDKTSPTRSRLKGMLIGDGCAGTDVLCGDVVDAKPWFSVQFFHGHGQISDKLYEQIVQVCGIAQLKGGVTEAACQRLIDQMNDALGGYFAYALYDEYVQRESNPQSPGLACDCLLIRRSHLAARCPAGTYIAPPPQPPSSPAKRRYWSSMPPTRTVGGALNDYPCGGVGAMLTWLNQSAVKAALHVPEEATFFLTDNGVGFNYNTTEKNLMPFYQRVVKDKEMRVLVYTGDTDPGVLPGSSQNWTRSLGFDEVEAWRPWTLDGKQRMGGYVTRYVNDFDFLTIRGSGHMVPHRRRG